MNSQPIGAPSPAEAPRSMKRWGVPAGTIGAVVAGGITLAAVLGGGGDSDASITSTVPAATAEPFSPEQLNPGVEAAVAPEASQSTETDPKERVELACAENDTTLSADSEGVVSQLSEVKALGTQDAIFFPYEDDGKVELSDHMAAQVCDSATLRAWMTSVILDAGQPVVNDDVTPAQRALDWFRTFSSDEDAESRNIAALVEVMQRNGSIVVDEDFHGPVTVLGARERSEDTDEATGVRSISFYVGESRTLAAVDLLRLRFNLDGPLSDAQKAAIETAADNFRINPATGEIYVVGEQLPSSADVKIDLGEPVSVETSAPTTIEGDPSTSTSTTLDGGNTTDAPGSSSDETSTNPTTAPNTGTSSTPSTGTNPTNNPTQGPGSGPGGPGDVAAPSSGDDDAPNPGSGGEPGGNGDGCETTVGDGCPGTGPGGPGGPGEEPTEPTTPAEPTVPPVPTLPPPTVPPATLPPTTTIGTTTTTSTTTTTTSPPPPPPPPPPPTTEAPKGTTPTTDPVVCNPLAQDC